MPNFRTLDSANLSGQRVLVRVDLNVPMENGKITDAPRIERAGGQRAGDPRESLKPVAAELHHILKRHVGFADDCIGEAAEMAVAAMKNGDVLLLEDTRFHKEEEKNEPALDR